MFIFTLEFEFISTSFMLYLNFPYVIKCIGTYKYLVEGCHRRREDLLYRWQPFVSNELNLGILFLLFFVGVSRLNVLKINKILYIPSIGIEVNSANLFRGVELGVEPILRLSRLKYFVVVR